jgi:hypothetical protein
MSTALKCALPLLLAIGSGWVMFGGGMFTFVSRIAIVIGAMLFVGILAAIANARQRQLRLERNRIHCSHRGYTFVEKPSIDTVFRDCCLFRNDNVRIEQLSQGIYRSVEVDVFDLSYDMTSRDNEGGTTTQQVAQTIVSFPNRDCAKLHVCVMPLRGLAGTVFRFLGLTGSVGIASKDRIDDQAPLEWFNKNYIVASQDEPSRHRAELVLQLPLLQWLRGRQGLAFEIVDGQVVVWRPNRVVDSTARDALVHEGLQLAAAILESVSSSSPTISITPPAVVKTRTLFVRMLISGFGSWFIALLVLFGGFFCAIASGAVERWPLPTLVLLMFVTMIVWVTSGILILRHLSRASR